MCGIAGFFTLNIPHAHEPLLKRMGETIIYRGPDAGGIYLDKDIGFVHRRLSIVDLSELGIQPMKSSCGRYVIVFNGEIYNFLELRKDLEKRGYRFGTHTDTEVILALFAEQGIECLKQMNGMFAFALWDTHTRTLFLARDRIGKKPLYYLLQGKEQFAFASEIKPLLLLSNSRPKLDYTALIDYLKYLYIPAPKTIYEGIFKLPPAHYMTIAPGSAPCIHEYWDVDFCHTTNASFEGAEEELSALLTSSTGLRMIADVPLGAFLSGGVDSSIIVALMSGLSKEKIKTCTIGFNDPEHDETPFAKQIARQFSTNHTEYFVKENLAETVTLLPRHFDEPFADSSAVPTYHVSRLARKSVTVALAGDGGDECFGGYDKYSIELIEDRVRRLIPSPLLSGIHAISQTSASRTIRRLASLTRSALMKPGDGFYVTNTFVKDEHLDLLLSDSVKRHCRQYDPAQHTLRYWNKLKGADHITRMLYTDIKTYLPGDILVKVDRMSMAHSLEVRAPLLDYRIVEFAAKLPSRWKINGPDKKHILKNTFAKLLPPESLKRKKHGFTVPLRSWFRNELRMLTEENLIHSSDMETYFSRSGLEYIWRQHQDCVEDHGNLLWSLLCFALWHKKYLRECGV